MMKETEVKILVTCVELTDQYEGVVKFEISSGRSYEAGFWGATFVIGEERMIELTQFGLDFHWKSVFSNNPQKEKKLEKGINACEYVGYGQIESINPIIADFGALKLDLGDWSNDERLIGEYIYWKIPRLDVAIGLLLK